MALHTPLAPWSDPAGYPPEVCRMDKAGHRLGELCVASRVYIDTKVARLKELCKHGAYFLMYDGSWFPGECWDKSHGHSLPVTHQEHVDAILKIEQQLHKAYPNVLIEQHDPMTGPGNVRYTPTYFMHAKPGRVRRTLGIRVHERVHGRRPEPPGVLALLRQSGLQHSDLSCTSTCERTTRKR